jgi:hypothetical protein
MEKKHVLGESKGFASPDPWIVLPILPEIASPSASIRALKGFIEKIQKRTSNFLLIYASWRLLGKPKESWIQPSATQDLDVMLQNKGNRSGVRKKRQS